MMQGFMNDLQLVLATITPLINKLQSLDEKVDRLGSDHATRSDIEKLRNELVGSFVPRDAYEERYQAFAASNKNLEAAIKNNRDDITTLINAKNEESRKYKEQIETSENKFEKMMLDSRANELSTKDRSWLRLAYISGFISVAIAIADAIMQHVKIS